MALKVAAMAGLTGTGPFTISSRASVSEFSVCWKRWIVCVCVWLWYGGVSFTDRILGEFVFGFV
jgi:hypothetical protein